MGKHGNDDGWYDDAAEETVHARADVDSRAFPCGVDARAMVRVGDGTEVTCFDCNAELQRRANVQTSARLTERAVQALMAINVALGAGELTHEQAHVQRAALWREIPHAERHEVTARLTSMVAASARRGAA